MAKENSKNISKELSEAAVEHSRAFIGSRQGIASTTNVETPAKSRPKKN